jgi:hypothetical protein
MLAAAQILSSLERVFGPSSAAEKSVVKALFAFLSKNPKTSHISLQLVRQILPNGSKGELDSVILRTLQFLAGDAVGLFDIRFEIIEGDEEPYQLEKHVVKEALALKVNPLTGDVDPQIATKIFIYFCPTPEAISSISNHYG